MSKLELVLDKFIDWRVRRIPEKSFIYFLSIVVGLACGLAALILKNLVHFTAYELTSWFDIKSWSYWYLALPMFGIGLTMLFVRYYVKDDISHGVTRILFAISQRDSFIRPHNNYTSIIGSSLTIGLGGSVGAEAPIVLTGASIGSNLARLMRMNYKTITLMIGCGAAGAIAGIFKAPLAGMLFTMEVLMMDLTMASLIPILISAVTSASFTYLLVGNNVLLSFYMNSPFNLNNIPYYIVLGVFCGFISLYFTRSAMWVESKFKKISNPIRKLLIGGGLLGILIFLFPPLWGEGYLTIIDILNGHGTNILNNSFFYGTQHNTILFLLFLALILVFKVVAMATTNGAGGVGGIFAPSLYMGGVAGYFLVIFFRNVLGIPLPEGNFSLVGMAGVMAGVMHAPLTAIFLIAEITGGYSLFIPLMITSTISYLTIMSFEPHSLYTKRLAERGELITHNKDKAVLTLLKLRNVIETDLLVVNENATLGQLVKTISKSNRNIFPVIDENGLLKGIVVLDDIRSIMFNSEMYDITHVHDLMISPPALVFPNENMDSVMNKFTKTGAWNLPVVEEGKYLGFVSKSKIFNAYRSVLVHFSDE
ncbi:MAG: chloride channel protein [Bacteroidota bacterium]|nr:chloride channel protein [Bacteroidota bacterium]MDP4206255.1 chloride channel protein [Bacteroidota bacterium]